MTTLFISHSSRDKDWADRVHRALRDAGYHCLFLDSHPDDGIHVGAEWERMLYQQLRSSRGIVALCSENWLDSPWCLAEVMMSRDRGKPVFLLVAAKANEHSPRIPEFLTDIQLISLGSLPEEEAYRQLLNGLHKEGLRKGDFKLPHRPYPGLEPFQESDAAIYFGRDKAIERVIAVLNRRRRNDANGFILVLGASGCGKSSLVRAGVLPRLKHASMEEGTSRAWVIPPPLKGGGGLDGLALSLAGAFRCAGKPRELAAIRSQLTAESDLRTQINELLDAQDAPEALVLLVIDQLEEVFGTVDGSDARTMLRLLLRVSADPARRISILATMRSDFLNAFQLFEGAAESYEEIVLDPMSQSRIGEVIEGPADRFGLDIEPGLSERMKEDTAYHDALPMLAFTLEKLYAKCRNKRQLTHAAYEQLGGVSAAIKESAQGILASAGYAEDDPVLCDIRRAFYSLANVGDEGQFTRRTARWSQLPSSCETLLERFVDQRLLVSDSANGERVVSVAHEAVFRVWDTLNRWLLQDRDALALRSQIESAAIEWQGANRVESRLWPEERIFDVVRRIDKSGVSLADVAHRTAVNAFLGPTDPAEIARLPHLGAADDATAGSGPYGKIWQLPLDHERRAAVGVRLALLGDTRKGVGVDADGLPDIDWCRIEGGNVTIEIRADPADPSSEVTGCHRRVVEPFWIARYPVTIAQFKTFLLDCDQNGRWKPSLGAPFTYLTGADWPPRKHRARYDNHPADNVKWVHAAAFCHWLTHRRGEQIALPNEFQWQLAATGGDPGAVYPWNNAANPSWNPEQEPWRANTFESELGRSTAVGMYPAGASPAGVLDMAGNVFEWCGNAFDDPLDDAPKSLQDRRVLRGGAWFRNRAFARLAVRVRPDLGNADFGAGFRLVCSLVGSSFS